MYAKKLDGTIEHYLAVNEISILRSGSQAAKLKIIVDDLVSWKNWFVMEH